MIPWLIVNFFKLLESFKVTTGLNLIVYLIILLRMVFCFKLLVWVLPKNEKVERKNEHILNVSRPLRFQAQLPFSFGVNVFYQLLI